MATSCRRSPGTTWHHTLHEQKTNTLATFKYALKQNPCASHFPEALRKADNQLRNKVKLHNDVNAWLQLGITA